MKKKVLLVEDELHIARLISHHLEKNDFELIHLTHGDRALEKFEEEEFDLLLLDLMLPGMDGLEICRKIREKSEKHVPIIMLTAKSHEVDKIVGLEMGADDYVTKPFSPRELISRIKAQLRGRKELQTKSEAPPSMKIGQLTIYPEKYRAFVNNRELKLTPKEFELLKFLATNRGQVFTRDVLLNRIWGYEYFGDTRTVDVHVRHLRQKLQDLGSPNIIETVRGIGYRFKEME